HGGGGGDGTPDDELPFDLPHAPSFVREPCAVRSGVQTGLPGLSESTVSSRFLFANPADAPENALRNGGGFGDKPGRGRALTRRRGRLVRAFAERRRPRRSGASGPGGVRRSGPAGRPACVSASESRRRR